MQNPALQTTINSSRIAPDNVKCVLPKPNIPQGLTNVYVPHNPLLNAPKRRGVKISEISANEHSS